MTPGVYQAPILSEPTAAAASTWLYAMYPAVVDGLEWPGSPKRSITGPRPLATRDETGDHYYPGYGPNGDDETAT
jgi:hypothetical protein